MALTRATVQGTTAKSTAHDKIKKPYRDFPLTPHRGTGRWCKKIRGKVHYFGRLDDPDAALAKWLEEKDDLLAGRTPRTQTEGLTLHDLSQRFLDAKRALVDCGELSARTWSEYHATCVEVAKAFGKSRLVADLRTEDFERLRGRMAKENCAVTLANKIQRVRTLFKYGHDAGLLAVPMRFGQTFKKPSARIMRQERHKRGPRMFDAADLRRLVEAAGQPLKTMILLATNCGFGNRDVSLLPLSAVDLERGWIAFPRPKTAIERRCPLWRETVDALREWKAVRPEPKTDDAKELVFVTRFGGSWAKSPELDLRAGDKIRAVKIDDPVAKAFAKLLRKLKLVQRGRGFYGIRHGFETIGGEAKDQIAVDYVMGHAPAANDMSAVYRERISDQRLRDVVGHVRAWLYPAVAAQPPANPAALLASYQAAVMAFAENPTDENRIAQDEAHQALLAAFASNGGGATPKKAK